MPKVCEKFEKLNEIKLSNVAGTKYYRTVLIKVVLIKKNLVCCLRVSHTAS